MSTVPIPRVAVKPSRTPQPRGERIARLHHLPSGLVLGLTAGKDTTFYGLKPLDHGFGQAACRLDKAERGGVVGEVYDQRYFPPESAAPG